MSQPSNPPPPAWNCGWTLHHDHVTFVACRKDHKTTDKIHTLMIDIFKAQFRYENQASSKLRFTVSTRCYETKVKLDRQCAIHFSENSCQHRPENYTKKMEWKDSSSTKCLQSIKERIKALISIDPTLEQVQEFIHQEFQPLYGNL